MVQQIIMESLSALEVAKHASRGAVRQCAAYMRYILGGALEFCSYAMYEHRASKWQSGYGRVSADAF